MTRARAARARGLIELAIVGDPYAQALWGTVAVTQAYPTLSEVLGHADLLVANGRVVEQRDDGFVRFASAS